MGCALAPIPNATYTTTVVEKNDNRIETVHQGDGNGQNSMCRRPARRIAFEGCSLSSRHNRLQNCKIYSKRNTRVHLTYTTSQTRRTEPSPTIRRLLNKFMSVTSEELQ